MNVGIFENDHVIKKANYHRCTWKIQSLRDVLWNDSESKSPLFTVPNRDKLKWYLSLQFGHCVRETTNYAACSLSLVLDRTSDCKDAFAKFNLFMKEKNGQNNSDMQWDRTFKFATKSENRDSVLLPINLNYSTITIVCELMIESICSEDNSFSNDYGALLNNQLLSDIVLSVGEKKYPAHKQILTARSSVFAAMFASNMIETRGLVRIEDMSEDVVEEMLRYIYTGEVEKLNDLAHDLLIAADKYDLKGLRTKCEKILIASLSSSNAFDLLLFAASYNANELKFEVINYLTIRGTEVVKTSAWKSICQSNPEILRDISEAVFSSMFVPEPKKNTAAQL